MLIQGIEKWYCHVNSYLHCSSHGALLHYRQSSFIFPNYEDIERKVKIIWFCFNQILGLSGEPIRYSRSLCYAASGQRHFQFLASIISPQNYLPSFSGHLERSPYSCAPEMPQSSASELLRLIHREIIFPQDSLKRSLGKFCR